MPKLIQFYLLSMCISCMYQLYPNKAVQRKEIKNKEVLGFVKSEKKITFCQFVKKKKKKYHESSTDDCQLLFGLIETEK